MPTYRFRTRVNQREAARYLREHHGIACTAHELHRLAHRGDGPDVRIVKHRTLYTLTGLDVWARGHKGRQEGAA